MKLLGNSAYDSLIMDKTKHAQIKYVKGVDTACLKVNERTFRNLTELSDDFFEIKLAKKKDIFRSTDLPWIFHFTVCKTSYA